MKGELDLRHAQVDDYKLSIRQMQVCQMQSLLVGTLWIDNLILSCIPELNLKGVVCPCSSADADLPNEFARISS